MNMFLLFSHKLTQQQTKDAIESLKVTNFIYLPDNLQKLWSNVPSDVVNLDEYIKVFKEFLLISAKKGDYVLIQGDFGVTCKMVSWCKEKGLKPVYSTTKRESIESLKDGKVVKTSKFEHVLFRSF